MITTTEILQMRGQKGKITINAELRDGRIKEIKIFSDRFNTSYSGTLYSIEDLQNTIELLQDLLAKIEIL